MQHLALPPPPPCPYKDKSLIDLWGQKLELSKLLFMFIFRHDDTKQDEVSPSPPPVPDACHDFSRMQLTMAVGTKRWANGASDK